MDELLSVEALAVTPQQRSEAKNLQERALGDPAVQVQAQQIYERYRTEMADTLSATLGITSTEALSRIPAYTPAAVEKKTVRLSPEHPVWIQGQSMTVTELVSRGAELDECAMADPIEGPEYGRTTAKFFYNSGSPTIHSWAHGDSTTYVLTGSPTPSTPSSPSPPDTTVQATSTTLQPTRGLGARCTELSSPLDVNGFPHLQGTPGNLRPKPTVENFRHLLDCYGITARYNVISKEPEINIPGTQGSPDNWLSTALTRIESLAALNGLRTAPVPRYLAMIADENLYNPIGDWIDSKPWDGQDRLEAFHATLTAREEYPDELKRVLLHRWLLSAVAAALTPAGFHTRGVLTLQGPQGLGKTSWIRSLVPDPQLQEASVLEGHHLDPANKDTVLIAIKHWIVELGELDSSFRKDIARIKGVITNKADKVRKPYAAAASEFQRRTVFAASVNEEHFLVDPTGNSRWWVIPLVAINYQHGIDMQQLFAQLAVEVRSGAQWWLSREEEKQLQAQNRWHEAVNVIEEGFLQAIDWDLPCTAWNRMTASDVLRALGYTRPTNAQARECGSILRKHLGPPKKVNGIQKWQVPLRSEEFPRISDHSTR